MTSLSPARATDVGIGLGEVALSGIAAWGCSKGVRIAGEKTEELIHDVWENTKSVQLVSNGKPIDIGPATFMNTESVIRTVQACTNSGSTAAIVVGFTETMYQAYRYGTSDHDKSWGTDMLEGGYRGGTVGAVTGFATGGETLGQRIAAAFVGSLVGSLMGNVIAGLGHCFRSIHLPK